MSKFQYILFDLDGTLTEPKTGITKSVAYALEYFGIHVENLDSLCKFIGPPLKDAFMEHYGFDEKKAELAVDKYREYFAPHGVYENEVYSGVENMLRSLKECGKTIILATSKPHCFATIILEHFKLKKYFDVVVGSELDGTRVKKGDVISYALELAEIDDKELAVMVGDREHDIIGAKENGLCSIGVLYGHGDRTEHENAGADMIVENVEELQAILMK